MAKTSAFTVPSVEEMEKTDEQVISVYATKKDVVSVSSCASSTSVDTSKAQPLTSVPRLMSCLQTVTKEHNLTPSTTTTPPTMSTLSSVMTAITDDNTNTKDVKTFPTLTENNQICHPNSGTVALSTTAGSLEPAVAAGSSKTGKANAIIVSARQKGNPVLKYIRNVPWEFGDIVPDYQLGQTSCALFLSTRYHLLYPAYIHERLKQLGRSFDLRVVLMLIDVKDPHHALKEVTKMCILADCSLILAFSIEEAGRYLETYKSFEKKPPDLIMEKTEGSFLSQVADVFTSARKINKTDAMTLLSTFGSVKGIVESSEDELCLCPGFGPQKAQKLHCLIHEPFMKAKKVLQSAAAAVQPSTSAGSTELKKVDKKETKKV